jgi:hypothetical protein
VFAKYPSLPLAITFSHEPKSMSVSTESTGKDFVAALGEPDRKGGGAGPSSGSINIWCEWTKEGVMVELGGRDARGPQAWDKGKDAKWKVISFYPPLPPQPPPPPQSSSVIPSQWLPQRTSPPSTSMESLSRQVGSQTAKLKPDSNQSVTEPQLSDDTDKILALQGVSWVTRRILIAIATITLDIKHYKDDEGVEHIDIEQTLTGGITASPEYRTLDWT